MPRRRTGAAARFDVHAPRCVLSGLAPVILSIAYCSSAWGGLSGLQRVAAGLGGITVVAAAPGQPNHLYVGSKDGLVQILNLDTGQIQTDAFLNLLEQLDVAGDGGLLGLAFHPDFQLNGKFYATVTVDNGGMVLADVPPEPPLISPFTVEVREYAVSANPLISSIEYKTVIKWVKPQADHTGGWLGFSPLNGYLYIATGDGGGMLDNMPGHTPLTGNAQDVTQNLMGKILRIDVDQDDFEHNDDRSYAIPPDNPFVGREGDDEIFAYGLRSPWKASFDRATGNLLLGDVGEYTREEINFIHAFIGGGQNFGWRRREGADPTPAEVGGTPPPANTHPIYDYPHIWVEGDPTLEGESVTGGFVYRGPDPELQGKYFFADFVSRQFWTLDLDDPYGTVTNVTAMLTPSAGQATLITTFAEDANGNLYVGTLLGDLFRIGTDAFMPGDFQGDARVDGEDLDEWLQRFGDIDESGNYPGDGDLDGDVDGQDLLAWQRHVGTNAAAIQLASRSSAVPEPCGCALLAFLGAWLRLGFTGRNAL